FIPFSINQHAPKNENIDPNSDNGEEKKFTGKDLIKFEIKSLFLCICKKNGNGRKNLAKWEILILEYVLAALLTILIRACLLLILEYNN
ncbi:38786_t:CDS:1, partial [Gigaspora margarita]